MTNYEFDKRRLKEIDKNLSNLNNADLLYLSLLRVHIEERKTSVVKHSRSEFSRIWAKATGS